MSTPQVRVEIQDPKGEWWMPPPAVAMAAACEAMADPTTLVTIGAEGRAKVRKAAAALLAALDRRAA